MFYLSFCDLIKINSYGKISERLYRGRQRFNAKSN